MPLVYNARQWGSDSRRLPALETSCVATVGNHRSPLDSIPEVRLFIYFSPSGGVEQSNPIQSDPIQSSPLTHPSMHP